jgi:2-succinyl-6-hydroxy-2,4-cyclohexadiene-1-carboxylate synthase
MGDTLLTKLHHWGDSAKPAILFLHGFLGSGLDWQYFAEKLSGNYFVVAPDLPGHGESETPVDIFFEAESQTKKSLKDALKAILADEHQTFVMSVGYSMGGRVLSSLFLEDAKFFGKVVLFSSSPGIKNESERNARRMADEKLALELKQGESEKWIEKWYSQNLFSTLAKNRLALSEIKSRRKNLNRDALAESLTKLSVGHQPFFMDEYRRLGMSFTLVAGLSDKKYVQQSLNWQRLCPKSELVFVVGASHAFPWEKKEAALKIIKSRLN